MKLIRRSRGLIASLVAAAFVGLVLFSITVPAQAANRTCSTATPLAQLPIVQYGDTGSCVVTAQQALIRHGFSVGSSGADGAFGSATRSAVIRFRAASHLAAGSVVDRPTWTKLRATEKPQPAPYDKYRGPNRTSRVVLTYDDCPKTLVALKSVLAAARSYNIGLVLAPTGNCIVSFRSRYGVNLPVLIRSYGAYVINHSVTHSSLTRLSYSGAIRELRAPGVVTNYGRPPFGAVNATVNRAYAAVGMRVWLWNVDTRDWTGKSSAQIASYVIANTRPGNTVLMHMQRNGFNSTTLRRIQLGLAAKHIGVCRVHRGASPVLLPSSLPC